ncbi:MAG: hypothetical protein U0K18_07355 [Acutalibacteraceae bacterium]|nr:hypothetical protein [Acutalibacteraceae bacterium]
MLLKNENHIIRILQKQEDKFLVIDCIKRTMPKWIEKTALSDYVDCCDTEMYECTNYHKQYGVKSLMVGLKKSDIQKDCFESAVMDWAESLAKEHMNFYYEEYMDYSSEAEAEIDAYCDEE